MYDVHGNMHVSAAPPVSSQRPSFLPDSEELRAMFVPPKYRHFLSRPLDRSSESKDSRAPDALEKKSSDFTLKREFKNSFVNSGSLASESLLPTSEAKSDTESELNLFTFPEEGMKHDCWCYFWSFAIALACTNEFLIF